MDEALDLIDILCRAAAALSAPQVDAGVIRRVLASVPAEAGVACHLRLEHGALVTEWDAPPTRREEAFVDALAHCVALAVAAGATTSVAMLGADAFLAELDRAIASARWRAESLGLCVFGVCGLELGPGPIDQRDLIDHVGDLARTAVRHGDRVGHLGADQFALLFPGAGTFEARAAFRRVSVAIEESELLAGDVVAGAAGFAELGEHDSGSELIAEARARQESRRRSFYPGDPTQPLAG
jgi:GGDEF domain-containing protein